MELERNWNKGGPTFCLLKSLLLEMVGRPGVLYCRKPSGIKVWILPPPGLGEYSVAVCLNRLDSRLCPFWVLIVAVGSSLGDLPLLFVCCCSLICRVRGRFFVSLVLGQQRIYIAILLLLLAATIFWNFRSTAADPATACSPSAGGELAFSIRFFVPVFWWHVHSSGSPDGSFHLCFWFKNLSLKQTSQWAPGLLPVNGVGLHVFVLHTALFKTSCYIIKYGAPNVPNVKNWP